MKSRDWRLGLVAAWLISFVGIAWADGPPADATKGGAPVEEAATTEPEPMGLVVVRLALDPSLPQDAGPVEEASVAYAPTAADADAAGDGVEPTERTASCTVDEGRFACALPAGTFDLCVETPGFHRSCFWNVEIGAHGEADLGTVQLARGARLHGWIEAEYRGVDLEGTPVELTPASEASPDDPSDRRRRKLVVREVESDAEGRFELTGLEPGSYQLRAVREGYFSEPQRVRVEPAAEEVALDRPLLLVPPAELEVFVEPPVDPWSGAWKLRLLRPGDAPERWVEVSKGVAGDSGNWSAAELEPGEYSLEIADSRGASWFEEDLKLTPGESSRFVEIEVVPVEGRLTLGGEGLAAEIVFGTTQGMVQIPMTSDEEGRFEGSLPNEGLWPLELRFDGEQRGSQAIEPVEVRRAPGRRAARLDVELPDTVLRGKVVRGGEGARAFVYGRGEDRAEPGLPPQRRAIMVQTEEDGSFELLGLAPGTLELYAYDRSSASEWREVRLDEGIDGPEIVLELRQRRTVAGRLVGPGGPVAGARLLAKPNAGPGRAVASGVDGTFELMLDADDVFVDFIVLPPSSGFAFQRVGVAPPTPDGEAAPMVLEASAGVGDLVLPGLDRAGTLRYGGVAVPFQRVLKALLEAGRVAGHPGGGLVLKDAAPGVWSFCSAGPGNECATHTLAPGGEAHLDPTAGGES